jgi:MraZ protein
MLIGQYEKKLSQKRRVAIPFKLKTALGNNLFVAKWYENCLVMVGERGWEEISKKLTAITPFATQPVRDTDRFILGSAYLLNPDRQGRVVLPRRLVKYAKLKSDVVFVGLGNRVEVWDKLQWEAREEFVSKNAHKFMEKIADTFKN